MNRIVPPLSLRRPPLRFSPGMIQVCEASFHLVSILLLSVSSHFSLFFLIDLEVSSFLTGTRNGWLTSFHPLNVFRLSSAFSSSLPCLSLLFLVVLATSFFSLHPYLSFFFCALSLLPHGREGQPELYGSANK